MDQIFGGGIVIPHTVNSALRDSAKIGLKMASEESATVAAVLGTMVNRLGNGCRGEDAPHRGARVTGKSPLVCKTVTAIISKTDIAILPIIGNDRSFARVFVRRIQVPCGSGSWGALHG